MNSFRALLAGLCLAVPVFAQTGTPAPKREPGPRVFSIMPKALQTNPRVAFNIITEMTDEGRRAPKPAPGAPIHYITKPAGFLQLGTARPPGRSRPRSAAWSRCSSAR